jgi:hypothetical protein
MRLRGTGAPMPRAILVGVDGPLRLTEVAGDLAAMRPGPG